MDLSDTVLLRESTKWWIVGAFLLIGAVFLVSRSGSDTDPVTVVSVPNDSDAKGVANAMLSTASEAQKPIICDAASCPECFQKFDNDPKSNFAAFDPFLTAIAADEKSEKAHSDDEELEQARKNLQEAIKEGDPRSNKAKKDSPAEKKQGENFLVSAPNTSTEKKALLHFVENVPLESEEWKKLTVEEKISRYLKMKVTFEPSELLIGELADQLGDALDVEVTIDKAALEEASYDTAAKLEVKSKRPRPLKSVLAETLHRHSLSYITHDEALVLTSQAKQKESMVTKIYPVVDLVMPLATDEDESPQPDFESLINLIQTTVKPKTWKEVSGDDNGGTIDRYQTTRLLVVRNTSEVHDEMDELFAQLRAIKSPSTRKSQNVAELPLDQPEKIVRRIYYISDMRQIGRSGAGAGRRGLSAYIGSFGGGMGGSGMGGSGQTGGGGGGGQRQNGGGLFAIPPEDIPSPSPATLSIAGASSVAAQIGNAQPAQGGGIGGSGPGQFGNNAPPAQQPAPNPQPTGSSGGLVASPPNGQPAPNQAGNPGAEFPEVQSDFLNAAQMKARMESLVDIIPGTVDPAHWDKEKTTISNMENRLIVIHTAASQIEIEKLLRGLKVLTRVEVW